MERHRETQEGRTWRDSTKQGESSGREGGREGGRERDREKQGEEGEGGREISSFEKHLAMYLI